jgi:hypothetical protein
VGKKKRRRRKEKRKEIKENVTETLYSPQCTKYFRLDVLKKHFFSQAPVAHAYNPSYSGGS